MRFIWDFFVFGILFYLIWMFFPDAFATLVSWANHVVVFFKELIGVVAEKSHHLIPDQSPPTPAPPTTAQLFMYFKNF